MKIKTSELTGAALDWAVAKCEGVRIGQPEHISYALEFRMMHDSGDLAYSTNWAQGGPIIERKEMTLLRFGDYPNWTACIAGTPQVAGPTPLIAAMRCYVAYKLGDEVEIPEELK